MRTDPHLGKFLPAPLPETNALLVDVLLLCVECQQPIKARINTNQWMRVEWIGPSGECQSCYGLAQREQKEKLNVNQKS